MREWDFGGCGFYVFYDKYNAWIRLSLCFFSLLMVLGDIPVVLGHMLKVLLSCRGNICMCLWPCELPDSTPQL